jgi:hypothetical protein
MSVHVSVPCVICEFRPAPPYVRPPYVHSVPKCVRGIRTQWHHTYVHTCIRTSRLTHVTYVRTCNRFGSTRFHSAPPPCPRRRSRTSKGFQTSLNGVTDRRRHWRDRPVMLQRTFLMLLSDLRDRSHLRPLRLVTPENSLEVRAMEARPPPEEAADHCQVVKK